MSLSVYVAGASSELDKAEHYVNRLRSRGVSISYDWPAAMRAEPKSDAELSDLERHRYGSDDLLGVRLAQVVWLLAPVVGSRGCWVELGYALALNRHVIVSGDDGRSIFTALAARRFDTHAAAEAYILDLEFAARDGAA